MPPSARRGPDSVSALCLGPADGFVAVASTDEKGRVRLLQAAGAHLDVAGGSWPTADGEGLVVLCTDRGAAPLYAPLLRIDGRHRMCLGTGLSRWLPEGPRTLVRYDPSRRRLCLVDAGLAGDWIDQAVQWHGTKQGWWPDDPQHACAHGRR